MEEMKLIEAKKMIKKRRKKKQKKIYIIKNLIKLMKI